jgi:hypothetical protein
MLVVAHFTLAILSAIVEHHHRTVNARTALKKSIKVVALAKPPETNPEILR